MADKGFTDLEHTIYQVCPAIGSNLLGSWTCALSSLRIAQLNPGFAAENEQYA